MQEDNATGDEQVSALVWLGWGGGFGCSEKLNDFSFPPDICKHIMCF